MKNKISKISALIITYNEINHIEDVIKNISFTDEIIVIDSFSTDGTLEKLNNLNKVKVIKRVFKNYADQRNFALQQASNEWVLFIDADERITHNLKTEITDTINNNTTDVGFMFKRIYFFNKKRIYFSGLQTDKVYRLFKKDKVKYLEDKTVHEKPQIDGESKTLKNPMLHYSFISAKQYKTKIINYAKLKALELFKNKKKPNAFHFYFKPIHKFLINYVFRLGFLDGKEGFIICYYGAYGVYYRYKELKKLIS